MKRIPAYLTDEEIARKITECVSSATGNIGVQGVQTR